MQVTTLLREVFDSLNLKLVIYAVTLDGGNYKCYVDSTHYLNTNKSLTINGIDYVVVAFEIDKTVTLMGASSPTIGSHSLTAPYFTHGKLKAVNKELSFKQPTEIIPLVWNFELQPRTRPAEVDTSIESTGTVKLFFMATANYTDFTTAQHYTECIEPMNNLVNSFIIGLDSHKRTGLVFEGLRMNHAKFTTGGQATASDENNVLPLYISGIELELTIPIILSTTCPTREYPSLVRASFNSGFDVAFEIN